MDPPETPRLTEPSETSLDVLTPVIPKLELNPLRLDPADSLLYNHNYADQLKSKRAEAKKRNVKEYYKRQLNLLDDYEQDLRQMSKFVEDETDNEVGDKEAKNRRWDFILSTGTLFVNLLLLLAKIVAAVFSGSLVVISSVVDSAMDLTTGLVIFFTTRAIKNRDLLKYPRGRTRLEPLALIVISVIMGAASVQIILKSIESLISGDIHPKVELPTLIIMISTVVLKFIMMIICCVFPSPSSKVLGQDHRNDCISNTTAIVCAYLASRYWVYLDPIAAILVSLYIIGTWMQTGFTNVTILSGKTASPEIINRIVKVCVDHRPKVDLIDTIFAYHFGIKYLVEVHVVLNENVTLKESHDISEPLQRKLEHLPFVERAFVHVDYDTDHTAAYEHKIV